MHATILCATDWSVLLSILLPGGIGNRENRTAFAFATLTAIADTIVVLVICKFGLHPDFFCVPPFG